MSAPAPAGHTVLLIEDDDGDALLIEEAMLSSPRTRSVVRSVDGTAALERLGDPSQRCPDLILLDLNTPRMDGRAFLAVVKGDDRLRSIPVVVLTGSRAPADVAAAYLSHANAYVAKPTDPDAFTAAIAALDAFFLGIATLPPHGPT